MTGPSGFSSLRPRRLAARSPRAHGSLAAVRHDLQTDLRTFRVGGGIGQLHRHHGPRGADHAVPGQGHAAGARARHRGRHVAHGAAVRVPQVHVLAHAPARVRLPGAAGRLRGRRLCALPAHILCAQRHVHQPVPGQAGLVLDAAVHRVVPGGHRPRAVPKLAVRHRRARRPAGGRHVLLVRVHHRVQPARGVLGPLLGARGPPRHPRRLPGRRARVEAVRRVRSRFHTRLQHAGHDQRGAAVRRLAQDPGRAAQRGERAHGGQDRGHHVQRPVRRPTAGAEGRLQADDALCPSAVPRHHVVRRHLGADAHHHHHVLPHHAGKTVGRHRGNVHVVRDVQTLVHLIRIAAAARSRVLQLSSASKE